MTIGPIVPTNIVGVGATPTGKAVEATVPTSATGDSTDRDADGRQVLDVFEKDDESGGQKEQEAEQTPEPPIAKPVETPQGGVDFLA